MPTPSPNCACSTLSSTIRCCGPKQSVSFSPSHGAGVFVDVLDTVDVLKVSVVVLVSCVMLSEVSPVSFRASTSADVEVLLDKLVLVDCVPVVSVDDTELVVPLRLVEEEELVVSVAMV